MIHIPIIQYKKINAIHGASTFRGKAFIEILFGSSSYGSGIYLKAIFSKKIRLFVCIIFSMLFLGSSSKRNRYGIAKS
jgi:hypothetical protein